MDVSVRFKAGGSFVTLAPQFSANSENVYVSWKNEILGYSTKTGTQFAAFKGIKDPIVGFGVHFYQGFECVTACSATGKVVTWKTATHFKILNKEIDIADVRTFHVIPSDGSELKALISFGDKNAISFRFFDLETLISQRYGLQIKRDPYRLDLSGSKYFAVVQKSVLFIIEVKNFLKTYTFNIEKHRTFTCLVCHPEEEAILTGDTTGRVVLWHGIFSTRPSRGLYHWHTLPVRSLAFSTNGSYFYSGGEESVLVRWQIDDQFSRKFLPRLPSSIQQISVCPDTTLIALSTNDNAVRIVDSKLDGVSLIQHLVIGDSFSCGIVVDPRTKGLVMNGNVGQIQIYSTTHNSLLYNVDVVGQNKISNERSCKVENTQVSKVAISKSGLWMATVECRAGAELRLKFWSFDPKIQNFRLNTCVNDPHENHVNSLLFQPLCGSEDLKLITVGGDKKFKVWSLVAAGDEGFMWSFLCMGYYHDLPCKTLSFSTDGSLVAVSFGSVTTTWLPDSCKLKCALSDPLCKEEITHVVFGNNNQCHLLVTASKERLSVWNLLTLTMTWTVALQVSILLADTITTNMAVFTKDRRIFVFTPSISEPIYQSRKLLKRFKSIIAAAFIPTKYSNDVKLRWFQRVQIYFVDSNRELYCLGAEDEIVETPTHIEEVHSSAFNMMLTQMQTGQQGMKSITHLFQKDTGQRNMKKYLEAPIQTMIPIRIMCGSLLRSMVLQKS